MKAKAPSKKTKTDTELAAWEATRDIGAELEQSVKEMLAGMGKAVSPLVAGRFDEPEGFPDDQEA